MTTLIPATVASPAYYLPRLREGLALDWDAADLVGTVADGAAVASWSSRPGSLAATHGTFGPTEGGYAAPVLDEDGCNGHPSLTLEGASRFKTYAGANGGPATGLTAISVAMVARWRHPEVFVNSIGQRLLFGANSGASICTIRPSGMQRVYWGSGAATSNSLSVGDPSAWLILSMSIDGATSLVKASGQDVKTGTANISGAESFKGLCLNVAPHLAYPADPSTMAMFGMDIARLRLWQRPLRASELQAQHTLWAADLGIAA